MESGPGLTPIEDSEEAKRDVLHLCPLEGVQPGSNVKVSINYLSDIKL